MNISGIITVAVLIEGLVEYGKTIADMIESGDKKTAVTQFITIIVGILLMFAFDKDLFAVIGMPVNHYIGIVLTGIIASRGSNYVSDLIGQLGQKTVG